MPRARYPLVGYLLVCLVALAGATGCGDDPVAAAERVAASCGDFACPAGTAPRERAALSGSIDISGGVDPSTYSGQAAYSRFGEGECEYYCETINPCPCQSENACTFPVITLSCFTCGTLNTEGEVQQGTCAE